MHRLDGIDGAARTTVPETFSDIAIPLIAARPWISPLEALHGAGLLATLAPWVAVADAGISGEMVRDPMITAVERRFGTAKTPHKVQWLSDNGSAYIAKETAETAAALGLALLFAPVRSPESNGMSESFVKILKRDYARFAILPDAATILAKLPDWIEDYCELHPHSGLKCRSPAGVHATECLIQPATCPVKQGAHQILQKA